MKRLLAVSAIVGAAALTTAPAALAHTPIGAGGNESLATATVIPDAAKSWVVYAELHNGGEAQYYAFRATQGERIPIELRTSPRDSGFAPSFVLMGPGIVDRGTVPSYVETPPGAGAIVVDGTPAERGDYEPFSPSATRLAASTTFDAPADGTYYVAVFDDERGGSYALAIGLAERFTASDWLWFPIDFASIYEWEGQSLGVVYAPALVTMIVGVVLLARRHPRYARLDGNGWIAAVAGLSFIAAGVTVAGQMAWALLRSTPDGMALITVFLAGLPVLVGVATVRLSMRRSGDWDATSRIKLALLGLAAAVLWAGWVLGPALAIVAALLPARRRVRVTA
jgi:hypothetical protein